MAEWGAVLIACGFIMFAAVAMILLHTLRRVLLRTEEVLGKAGLEISQLASESKELLVQASATLSLLQDRVEEVEPFCESLRLAGASLSNTLQRADSITQVVTDSAMERLERAHRENELRFAEAFRWLDAGISVWHSFKRQSGPSADDHA
ncbi:DUF948 domain-containing protein [Paenibacillus dokdonensis]|uniref:DUF948 domain-containing protein n=1 Tax=Paenibacillus dokdonensis TaxID=2567944 RepID=A0ABU6GHC8_9BACL|nr:DUF948 domain-containing protein [Paenibacillus dokdonensis]MEC0239145.1 DUF948 domain-containing protein [Paenibacillus dokdonensis]